jgi:hypothetical protein
MSYTITTNSGTEFFTNVHSQGMIGNLCKLIGATYCDSFQEQLDFFIRNNIDRSILDDNREKCLQRGYDPFPALMAYKMTESESIDTANKIRAFVSSESLSTFFNKGYQHKYTIEEFTELLLEFANDFEKSKGYVAI